MDIQDRIKAFKLRVDDDREFIDLPLEEFIESIALTKEERREAKLLLKQL